MGLLAAVIFLSAFLLFQIQPIIGRVLLPWFGGTPAVWTTCMLFFQALLLGGYAWSHWVALRLTPRKQGLLHVGLLSLALVALVAQLALWGAPLIPSAGLEPPDSLYPTRRILGLLALSVGLPYFVLSTTGPLLQAWFARAWPDKSAYRLYSLSNLGSMLGLLSYPFVFEPALSLRGQGRVWAGLFLLFAVGGIVTALRAARAPAVAVPASPEAASARSEERPPPSRWILWIALAGTASAMLLATTNQICQEVAVVPFLWILPLAIYLSTFILTFESDRWYTRNRFIPALVLLSIAAAYALYRGTVLGVVWQIIVFAALLFVGAMICHGEMVRLRPAQRYLTSFYLASSIGGAAGGLFVGLLAPQIFSGYWELHVSILAVWFLVLVCLARDRQSAFYGRLRAPARFSATAAFLAIMLVLTTHASTRDGSLLAERDFYGLVRVREERIFKDAPPMTTLLHGRITHGLQFKDPKLSAEPAAYFAANTGIGTSVLQHPKRRAGQPMKIGVIGLGIGIMAGYGERGDRIRFYEISPKIVELARGRGGYFSFLSQSKADVEIVLGDARISLERELRESGPQGYDLLVLDAFSSDSIPAHLLTREALDLYAKHLAPDGLLVLHISNRYLDLRPVVSKLAADAGFRVDLFDSKQDDEQRMLPARWVVLERGDAFANTPEVRKNLTLRDPPPAARAWTDDYAPLFSALGDNPLSDL